MKKLTIIFSFLFLSILGFGGDTLKKGLICHWDFDAANGKTVKDLSGNGHNAVLYGKAQLVKNVSGDGEGSVVQLNEYSCSSVRASFKKQFKSFSVVFWLNPFSLRYHNQGIAADGGWNYFDFHATGNGAAYIGTDVATRFTPREIPANTIEENKWQMIVYTFDNCDAKFYINGRMLAEKANKMPLPWRGFSLTGSVDGLVDDLRIYDRAISGKEVMELFDRGRKKHHINPVDAFLDNSSFGYFHLGKKLPLHFEFHKLKGAYAVDYKILDIDGKVVGQGERSINVKGGNDSSSTLDIPAPERYGIYWLEATVNDSNKKPCFSKEFPFAVTVPLPSIKEISPQSSPFGICYMDGSRFGAGKFWGMKWNRIWGAGVTWFDIEKEPGKYDWRVLDKLVERAKADGYELLYTIHGTPNWAATIPDPENRGYLASLPKDMETWKTFIRKLVTRYKDKIKYWDVWNEPLRKSCGMRSNGETGEDYFKLLKAAYPVIKEVDPEAKVVGINDYPKSKVTCIDGAKKPGYEEIFKLGGGKYLDIVSYHYYNMNNPNVCFKQRLIETIKEVILKYVGKPLPLWDCEASFTSPPRVNNRPMSEAEFKKRFGDRFKGASLCFNDEGGIIEATEHRSACWEIQAFLLGFACGTERRFTFGGMNNINEPCIMEKGVAIAALVKVVGDWRDWKSFKKIDMGTDEANGVMMTKKNGQTVAVLWSTSINPVPVTVMIKGDKKFKGMDFLGNPISVNSPQNGVLNIKLTQEPIYVFGVPPKIYGVEIAALSGDSALIPDIQAKGALSVKNPFERKINAEIKIDKPEAWNLSGLPDSISLKPGEEKPYPYLLTAKTSSEDDEGFRCLRISLIEKGRELCGANKSYFVKSILSLKHAPEKITVDGNPEEWKSVSGKKVNKYKNVIVGTKRTGVPDGAYSHWLGEEDLSCVVKSAWDKRGIYFLIEVEDRLDAPQSCPEAKLEANPWEYDGVEIFLNLNKNQSDAEQMDSMTQAGQIIILPCFSDKARTCQKVNTSTFFDREGGVVSKFVGKKTPKGYLIEGRICPGRAFALKEGALVGFDVAVDDRDDKRNKRKSQIALHAQGSRNFRKPSTWGRYRLCK